MPEYNLISWYGFEVPAMDDFDIARSIAFGEGA